MFYSTKTFPHSLGLSAAFRQHRADSHCRFVHGYALQVKVVFAAMDLDARNWVVDFGGLKNFKQVLVDNFDHKLVVAEDDPELPFFREMEKRGLAQLNVLPSVGCEMFAKFIFEAFQAMLAPYGFGPRVFVWSVEVSEHEGNSAIYTEEQYFSTEEQQS